jgi:hypothetical protein
MSHCYNCKSILTLKEEMLGWGTCFACQKEEEQEEEDDEDG